MSEPVLVQPVESPVICKPYYEPAHYWEYDRNTGYAQKKDGRRLSAYWYKDPSADIRRGQMTLELEEDRRELVCVNKLRADVKRWREANWEGATNITKDLLRHWWRKDRARRFFFCQLEAAETIIFLNEIRGYRRDGRRGQPRWKPEFGDGDFDLLWNSENNIEPLTRYATKMATGSGKTVVMSMLIAWAFCNRARVPSDERFPNAALIVCPNLTIKERLQVLRTDVSGEDYYSQFDVVPPQYHDLIRTGKVLVTNWHFFAPQSEHSEGGKSFSVVRKGAETDEAFGRNRLGELFERGPIMVLNDEGHHAYRPRPLTEEEKRRIDSEAIKEREEATVWVQGLDRIGNACGIKFCVDLSATPFYIAGSGYPEGEPFPWIVSDFGLVDAIESGITKIPRLPVSDLTGKPDPQYFKLWHNITKELKPTERLSNGRPKPEAIWIGADSALQQLAGEYKKQFDAIQQASDTALKAPPVMILVCDNTNIAQLFFENISGQSEQEEIVQDEDDDDEEEARPAKRKKRPQKVTVYGAGKVFPDLFQNDGKRLRSVRIDSKQLERAESDDPDASRDDAAKELREIVNSIGRIGKPGQDVRCVVSVAMLNEGWDANNVTHILGLRAFGSQLLCEQVVGRGLRRMNYTPDTESELLPEEYVDVYGIPFSVIPYKGKPSKTPPDRPVNHVKALPERAIYEIRYPNVEGYVYSLTKPSITVNFAELEPLRIEPERTPTATFLRIVTDHIEGSAGGGGIGEFVEHNRSAYYAENHLQGIEFEIARQVVAALVGEGTNAPVSGSAKMRGMARHELFPQVLRIVRRYVEEKVDFSDVNPCELGLEKYVRRIKERLLAAVTPDERKGEAPLLPLLNRFMPVGTTADVNFTTRKNVHGTNRSHVNAVVLDSQWEQTAAFQLEQMVGAVSFYIRNERAFLRIPYEYEGLQHYYEPDYIVRMKSGESVILEIKGAEDDQDKAKYQAARRWVKAVNNWAQLGSWSFAVCRDVNSVKSLLATNA